jgi:hypothetical protein
MQCHQLASIFENKEFKIVNRQLQLEKRKLCNANNTIPKDYNPNVTVIHLIVRNSGTSEDN